MMKFFRTIARFKKTFLNLIYTDSFYAFILIHISLIHFIFVRQITLNYTR